MHVRTKAISQLFRLAIAFGLMHDDDVAHLYFDNHENMTQQESADLIALLTIRPAVQETS